MPVVMVSGSMGSLKVALMVLLIQTPTAALLGLVDTTVGAVLSGAVPVVNVQVKVAAMALSATSLTALVSVAVQRTVEGEKPLV